MPLGKNIFTCCVPSLAVPSEAASSVFNHWGVFSLLERILPIALFSRVWDTVKFTAVTKSNVLMLLGIWLRYSHETGV